MGQSSHGDDANQSDSLAVPTPAEEFLVDEKADDIGELGTRIAPLVVDSVSPSSVQLSSSSSLAEREAVMNSTSVPSDTVESGNTASHDIGALPSDNTSASTPGDNWTRIEPLVVDSVSPSSSVQLSSSSSRAPVEREAVMNNVLSDTVESGNTVSHDVGAIRSDNTSASTPGDNWKPAEDFFASEEKLPEELDSPAGPPSPIPFPSLNNLDESD